MIDRTGAEVDPEAGYPTSGLSRSFETPQNEDLLLEPEPVVSVGVQQPETPPGTEPPVDPNESFPVVVSGDGARVLEGSSGNIQPVTFLLTLDKASDVPVQVTYQLKIGTAAYGFPDTDPQWDWHDLGLEPITVTIEPGITQFPVPVFINQDSRDEGDENFRIEIIGSSGASIDPANSVAIITIVDDDSTPVANDDQNAVKEDGPVATAGNVIGSAGASEGDVADTDEDGDIPQVIGVSFGGAEVAVPAEGPVTVEGQYGTLTLHSDGSYSYELTSNDDPVIQGLGSGDSLSEVFVYSITDGVNGTQSAELTINISGTNDVPTVTVDTGNPEGANDVVAESGLAQGSDAAAQSEFAAGTFTLADADGLENIQSISINGTSTAIGDLVGASFAGANGTLTITGFENGVASYSYELTAPAEDLAGIESDVFTLTVTDGESVSAPASITIEIADDLPNAVDDAASVAEEAASAISGNVLTNDVHGNGQPGADVPTTFVAWGSTDASFGTFTDLGDGNYGYLLDNGNPAVQALDSGETLTETFSYSITDADGDPDSATLTITITGTNDVPQINVDPGNDGANDVVNESGLAQGSDAAADSEFATGTFTLSDADGLDDLESVTINGTTVAIGSLVGASFAGTSGTLTITAYADGVASYQYELTSPATDGAGVETDVFSLSVSDGTSSSEPADITIEIVDDVQNAIDDSNSVEEGEASAISGNVLTNDLHGNGQPGADTPVSFGDWESTNAQYGTFTDLGDGNYSYTLNNDLAAVKALVDGETLTETFNYSMTDADGDERTATLTITINGVGGGVVITGLDGEGAEEIVDEANLADGSSPDAGALVQTGTFGFTAEDGIGTVQIGGPAGLTLTLADLNDLGATPQSFGTAYGTLTLTGFSGDEFGGTLNYSYQLDDNVDNDSQAGATDGDYLESIGVVVTDHDGSTDSASFDVQIIDDVPSVSAAAVADGDITLTTQDADTQGGSDSDSASFAAAMLAAVTPVYGADGAGSTSLSGYSLSITGGDGTDSGLTSGGEAISLSLVGGDVVGSTSGGEVFRISVDGTGTVTLTQSAAIDHLPEDLDASNDNSNLALSSGLVSLSATATTVDSDNDTATTTVNVDLGGNVSFDDDVPSVSAAAVADGDITLTTQDADTQGGSDSDSASFAAAMLAAVTPVYGADGAGSTSLSGYSLSITGGDGTDSGLTSGGEAISLSLVGGDVVGSTSGGEVFRISVDGTGTVTLTQSAAIDHLPEDLDASNDNSNLALSSGLVSLSATATTVDSDNDTATTTVNVDLGGNVSFDDDVPSVSAAAVADGDITLTTQDADTQGGSDSDSASFAAAMLAAVTPVYGADGAGSTSLSGYSLSITGGDGTDSGLTSGGEAISLSLVGGDVVGSTSGGEVFRISVDGTGTVTLTQSAAIDHLPEDLDASNDNSNLALSSGLVSLSATATTVDSDNDTATTTVNVDLGGNVSFDDDVPSVSAAAVADDDITLTTQDADTQGGSDSDSASFAAAMLAAVTPVYGADGAGSTSLSGYSLSITGGDGTDSGLTSGGEAISLSLVGGDVVGSTSGGEVFRISVDGTGTVTLTQSAAIDHLPEDLDASNDNSNLALSSGLVSLSATATTVDSDNDTATTTVNVDLGGNVSFDDDVPSVSAAAVADGDITLTTQDADTQGGSDSDSASFAAAMLAAVTPVYGADGAGSTSLSGYSLSITGGDGTDSGLTSGGEAISLSLVGGDVVGSTSGGEVFRISVDGTGTVTLTQSAAIDHLPEDLDASNDNSNLALSSGLVSLSATATTVDSDNDTATTTVNVDLGGNVSFDDDVPSVSAAAVADGDITLTTQDADTQGGSDSDSASFAAAMLAAVTPVYGADGAGSTSLSGYSLSITGGDGTDSGLTSGGEAISLSLVGGDVVGSTSGGEVFRISVDGTGTVTLTQSAAIDHLPEDLDASNDNSNLALSSGLVSLSATATTVDSDNDTATTTVNVDLGGNVSFDDDVPSVSAAAVADGDITLTTQDADTQGGSDSDSASFAAAMLAAVTPVYGADGAGSTSLSGYSLSITGGDGTDSGLTSGGEAISLSLVGGDVVGSTSGGEVFRISVDGTGTVTLTQSAAIDHLPEDLDASNDNSNLALSSGLVSLSATATTVDSDNDTATTTVNVDLGGNVSFDDDVPSVSAAAVADDDITLTTQDADTQGGSDSDSASFAAAMLAAVTPVYGADGAGSTSLSGYSLSITGGDGTDSGLTSGGEAISLSLVGGDVVGSTSGGEVFRISVDGTGTVTLTQSAAIDHLPEDLDASNDNSNLALSSGLVSLSATATTVDSDNDTATTTVNVDLGGNVSFDDDVPSVSAAAVADGDITLTTQDADTQGGSDSDSASFAAAMLAAVTPVYGADGAGSTSLSGYSLSITGGDGTDSGLTSGGEAISLSLVGGDVVGSTSGGEVFRISVDGTGTVTLTQSAAIDHLPEDLDASNDNSNLALSSGLVSLSATATTVDSDNDTATTTVNVDLGGNVSFDDDVPSVSAAAVADGDITLTTQDADTQGGSDSDSASFAAAMLAAVTPVYGADGAGSTSLSGYSLSITGGDGTDSGLTSGGEAISLSLVGGDVVGSTSGGEVFRISVDGTGTVTLTQSAAIDHLPEDLDASNDNSNLALSSGLVSLSATATTVDSDNDTATTTVNVDLGGNVSFDDDVPTLEVNNLAIANIAAVYEGVYDFDSGADTQAFTSHFDSTSLEWSNANSGYELVYDAGSSTADAQVFNGVYNGGSDTFFTIQVNSDGTYDFNLVTPAPVVEVPVGSLLAGISGGSNLPSYTFEESIFGGYFDIVVTGESLGAASTLTISSTDLGVADNVMHGNKSDKLRFDVVPVAAGASLSLLMIDIASTGGVKASDEVDVRVVYTNGSETNTTEAIGSDYAVMIDTDTALEVDYIELSPHDGSVSFKIDGLSANYVVNEYPDDYQLDFKLTGTDADNDTDFADFSVSVHTTDTDVYEIVGTAADDSVHGTSGNDILTGDDGADIFVWNDGDEGGVGVGNFAEDTVTDFNAGEGDVLDLSDLLVGENAGNIGNFIFVDESGGDSTLYISTTGGMGSVVDVAGAEAAADQVINLDGVTGIDINTLVSNGNLDIDN
ncbi:DUF5801 repeats-in-toxin domain-containing protein [Marinobacterium aestuariivivens]|uniref:DUF5801 repeats-in-toxin domain-containing protein n=1 Tax=Marinobacterium aestuariivivens TaxID=1698799 RepID=A0ABW2A548_9GAMM